MYSLGKQTDGIDVETEMSIYTKTKIYCVHEMPQWIDVWRETSWPIKIRISDCKSEGRRGDQNSLVARHFMETGHIHSSY